MPEAGRVWITRPAFSCVCPSPACGSNCWRYLALGLSVLAVAAGPLGARDSDYETAVAQAHKRYAADQTGKVTNSIPALASVSPNAMASSSCASTAKCSSQAMRARRWCRLEVAAPVPRRSSRNSRARTSFVESVGALAGTAPRAARAFHPPVGQAIDHRAREGAPAPGLVQPQANAEGKWRALLDNLMDFQAKLASTSVSTSPRASSAERLNAKRAIFPQEDRLADEPGATADLYLRKQGSVAHISGPRHHGRDTRQRWVNPVNQKRVVSQPVARRPVVAHRIRLAGGKEGGLAQGGGCRCDVREFRRLIIMVVPGRLGMPSIHRRSIRRATAMRDGMALPRYLVQTLFIGPDPTRAVVPPRNKRRRHTEFLGHSFSLRSVCS